MQKGVEVAKRVTFAFGEHFDGSVRKIPDGAA
ncbi:hypothetical protein BH23GEM6_BH23GEM6_00460 [soil metagenome]